MKEHAVALFLVVTTVQAFAKEPSLSDQIQQSSPAQAQTTSQVESAFSPERESEALVLKVINTSEKTIRLAAYSFTSPAIVKALLAAKNRDVDVQVVVDDKGNRGKANIAALNLLVNTGIPTRTISAYAIHHDKYIVSDNRHVQTGSFNYSRAAAKSNSENVIVIWNNPDLAASFMRHWQSRWEQGKEFQSTY